MTAKKYIKLLLVVALLTFTSITVNGTDYYAKGVAKSNISVAGKVYVNDEAAEKDKEPGWNQTEKQHKKQGNSNFSFYFYAKVNDGYKFLGWKVDEQSDTTKADLVFNGIKQDVIGTENNVETSSTKTCTAIFTELYNITYKNEDSILDYDPKTYYTECTDKFPSYSEEVEKGYKFIGWSPNHANGKWDEKTLYTQSDSFKGKSKDVTLTAKLEIIKGTITLDPNGGSVNPTTISDYDVTTNITLPEPKRPGYTYIWKVTSESGGSWTKGNEYKGYIGSGHYGNVTLTAQWTSIEYDVTYNAGTVGSFDNWEGGIEPSGKYTTDDDGAMPKPIKNGYTFVGWKSTLSDGDWGGWDADKIYKPGENDFKFSGKWGNVTLTAQWEIASFTLTLDVPEGTVVKSTEINYTITSNDTLPAPTLEGCTFKNWKVTTAGGNWGIDEEYEAGSSVNGKYGDATLTAQWEVGVKISVSIANGYEAKSKEEYIVFKIDGPLSFTVSVKVNGSESLNLQAGDYTISTTDWHKLLYSVEGPSNFKTTDEAIELKFTATPKNVKIGEAAREF